MQRYTVLYLLLVVRIITGRTIIIIDHPRSDVAYNFGCQTITFKSLTGNIGSSYLHFAHPVYLQEIWVKFIYKGHGSRKGRKSLFCNVKLPSAITPVL